MKIHFAAALWLACAAGMAPFGASAQTPQIGPAELAQAKTALNAVRAQLTAEQFALMSRKLAAAEAACAELATTARASQAAAAAAKGGAAAAGTRAATTVGRALVSGVGEVLPFILLVWPATAHAPGVKGETPEVQAAKKKADEALRELAQATRQVEAEQQAAVSRAPEPTLERCLEACIGGPEARAAFGRTLPNKTEKQRKQAAIFWATVQEPNPQVCKNACYAIFSK